MAVHGPPTQKSAWKRRTNTITLVDVSRTPLPSTCYAHRNSYGDYRLRAIPAQKNGCNMPYAIPVCLHQQPLKHSFKKISTPPFLVLFLLSPSFTSFTVFDCYFYWIRYPQLWSVGSSQFQIFRHWAVSMYVWLNRAVDMALFKSSPSTLRTWRTHLATKPDWKCLLHMSGCFVSNV